MYTIAYIICGKCVCVFVVYVFIVQVGVGVPTSPICGHSIDLLLMTMMMAVHVYGCFCPSWLLDCLVDDGRVCYRLTNTKTDCCTAHYLSTRTTTTTIIDRSLIIINDDHTCIEHVHVYIYTTEKVNIHGLCLTSDFGLRTVLKSIE